MPELLLTFWILVLFVFLIIEFTRVTFDYFPFAAGAGAAAVCYLLNLNLVVQIVAFAVLAAVCWFAIRPTLQRRQADLTDKPAIDPDEYIGDKVMVTGKIDDKGWGRIAIGNTEYRARAENPAEKYNVADYVTITGVDGQWVIVKR